VRIISEDKELDSAFAKVAESKKISIRKIFQTKYLLLHLSKQLINYCAKELIRLLPQREPESRVEQVIDQLFRDLIMFEARHARAIKRQDKNFQTLLMAIRKTLLYIMREDLYYRNFVAIGLIETRRVLGNIPREQLLPEGGIKD